MVDYLLSENGAQIRQQLSVQLVDQVDQLGVDAITFARKNVGQVRRLSSRKYAPDATEVVRTTVVQQK